MKIYLILPGFLLNPEYTIGWARREGQASIFKNKPTPPCPRAFHSRACLQLPTPKLTPPTLQGWERIRRRHFLFRLHNPRLSLYRKKKLLLVFPRLLDTTSGALGMFSPSPGLPHTPWSPGDLRSRQGEQARAHDPRGSSLCTMKFSLK